MNSDSNKLLPAYRRLYKTPVKGKRTVISIALDQPKIRESHLPKTIAERLR